MILISSLFWCFFALISLLYLGTESFFIMNYDILFG